MSAMDILRPKIQRIGNMCFRRLDLPSDGVVDDLGQLVGRSKGQPRIDRVALPRDAQTRRPSPPKLASIDALEAAEEEDEEEIGEQSEDKKYDIRDISGGKGTRFKANLRIAKYFHKFIIGFRGNMKRELEDSSRTRITVPSPTDLTSDVVVTGNARNDVRAAIDRINVTIERARDKSDFTHFVSIPFNQSQIRDKFLDFKSEVMKLYKSRSEVIDENLFQNSSKLHLTITPLLLTDQNERRIASGILDECYSQLIEPMTSGNPIKVRLEGIDYMNDDPTQVNVLYAKAHDVSDKPYLIQIVNYLYDRFKESGLMVRSKGFDHLNSESRIKIHVTLMNTIFLAREDDHNPGHRRSGRPNRTRPHFDAQPIIDKFKDYCFGDTVIDTIEISIRHTSGGKDGYYSHTHRIDLR